MPLYMIELALLLLDARSAAADRRKAHEPRRTHREAPRHQAREGLDLETHMRRDRRHVARDGAGRRARPAEEDKADGGRSRKAVRPVEGRRGAAQRGPD